MTTANLSQGDVFYPYWTAFSVASLTLSVSLFYSLTMIIAPYNTLLKTWLGCQCDLFPHSACWVYISDSSPRQSLQGPSMWNMPLGLLLSLSLFLSLNSQMSLLKPIFDFLCKFFFTIVLWSLYPTYSFYQCHIRPKCHISDLAVIWALCATSPMYSWAAV